MDIWSLGCCVLEMATGKRPWSNLDNEWAVMYHVVSGQPPLPDSSQLSELGIDFLEKCFIRSAQQRPSAKELLKHPWIDAGKEPTNMTPSGEWPVNGSMVSTSGTSGTSISNSLTTTTPNNSTTTTPFINEPTRKMDFTTHTTHTTQGLELVSDEDSGPSSPSLPASKHSKEHVEQSQRIFMMKGGLPSSASVISVESEGADPVTSLNGDDWSLIGGSD